GNLPVAQQWGGGPLSPQAEWWRGQPRPPPRGTMAKAEGALPSNRCGARSARSSGGRFISQPSKLALSTRWIRRPSGHDREREGVRKRSWDGSTDEPPASQSWADWSVQQADLAQKRGVTCIGAERVEPRIPNKVITRGILQRCGPVEFRECFVLPPKLSVDLRAGIICLVAI